MGADLQIQFEKHIYKILEEFEYSSELLHVSGDKQFFWICLDDVDIYENRYSRFVRSLYELFEDETFKHSVDMLDSAESVRRHNLNPRAISRKYKYTQNILLYLPIER